MTPQPLRLVVFAPSARAGGPLRYLGSALPLLCRLWPGEVHLVVPRESIALLPSDLALASLTVLEHHPSTGWFHQLWANHRLARRVHRETRPDIVFCLGNLAYFGPRVPCVTLIQNAARVRDLRWASTRSLRYFLALRALLYVTVVRSRGLIAVSQYTSHVTPLSVRASARTQVVHHGAPSPSTHPLSAEPDGNTVLLPTSVFPYKGIEHGIRALTRSGALSLRIAGPIGDDRYAERCHALAAGLSVTERISWLGPLSTSALLAEMRTGSPVLITSRAEACPNVLFEAAAADPYRPIVAIKYRWNAEYSDLIDVRCGPGELAEVLGALPLRSPIHVARRRVAFLTRFSWEHCIEQTRDVLLRSLSGAP